MSGSLEPKKDNYLALGAGAIVLATLSVLLVHKAALALETLKFHSPLNAEPFTYLVNFLQVLLIGILFVILGSILHRYPEPYFILWFFGWVSWLFLYLSRLADWRFTDVFNGLNSYFFLVAGATLTVRDGTKLAVRIRKYPGSDLAAHIGGPVVWLGKYFWMNWRVLLPLPFMIAPAWIEVYHKDWVWPADGWMSRPVYLELEVLFSVMGIALLGCGLYRRFAAISRPLAVAAIAVHTIYLQPQLAKAIFDLTHGERSFGFLFEVLATSVVCKPALALFVTLLALTETEHQRLRVLNILPAAYVVVREGLIEFFNERAREMFGLIEGDRKPMAQLFESADEMSTIREKLGRTDSIFGHFAALKRANGADEVFRIDAFHAGGSTSEIIFLILDRHDHKMADGVVNYAHTCIKSRLQVENRSPATSSLIDDLLARLKTLEQIWKNYGFRSEEKTPTSSLKQCLDLAYLEGQFKFHKRDWPKDIDYTIPSLNPESVQDLFRNIFSNIDQHAYGENGAGKTGKPVAVRFASEGNFVVIRVTDEGRGFPGDVISAVNSPRLIGKRGLGLREIKLTVAASLDGKVQIGNNDPPPGGWVEIKLRGARKENGD